MMKPRSLAIDYMLLIMCLSILYHYHWSLIFIAYLPRLTFLTAIMYVKASPITIPFADRRVTLGLDGQYANFRIDTGSARFFAIYGPEYEKRNGEGSCKDKGLCYFCPPSNPCDDIFYRESWRVRFRNGVVYTYVEHIGTLLVGGVTIPHFKFGLAIGFYDESGEKAAFSTGGQLGLSYGREGIPETFLEQLQRRKVISHHKFWIHTVEGASSFTGDLILDEPSRSDSYAIRLGNHSRHLRLQVWSMHLLSPQGHFIPQRVVQMGETKTDGPTVRSVDTGTVSIHATLEEFNMFRVIAENYLRPNSEWGLYEVNKEDIKNLPTLFYHIGDLDSEVGIRIQPKHYVKCNHDGQGTCFVYFRYWSEDAYVMGRPFFYAYDVGFDLESNPPFIYLKAKDADNDVESITPEGI